MRHTLADDVAALQAAGALELADNPNARDFLAGNPKGKLGAHRYTPEQFGLDPAEFEERYRFYSGRFGIERGGW